MFFQWLCKCGILVISFREPYDLNCGEQILIYKKNLFIIGQGGNSENNTWAVSEKDKVTFMFWVICSNIYIHNI